MSDCRALAVVEGAVGAAGGAGVRLASGEVLVAGAAAVLLAVVEVLVLGAAGAGAAGAWDRLASEVVVVVLAVVVDAVAVW